MPDPVVFQHPTFPGVVQEVPAEKVQEHLDAGWVRVKRTEEAKAKAKADESPVQ